MKCLIQSHTADDSFAKFSRNSKATLAYNDILKRLTISAFDQKYISQGLWKNILFTSMFASQVRQSGGFFSIHVPSVRYVSFMHTLYFLGKWSPFLKIMHGRVI